MRFRSERSQANLLLRCQADGGATPSRWPISVRTASAASSAMGWPSSIRCRVAARPPPQLPAPIDGTSDSKSPTGRRAPPGRPSVVAVPGRRGVGVAERAGDDVHRQPGRSRFGREHPAKVVRGKAKWATSRVCESGAGKSFAQPGLDGVGVGFTEMAPPPARRGHSRRIDQGTWMSIPETGVPERTRTDVARSKLGELRYQTVGPVT
jgi:hypothetical protein